MTYSITPAYLKGEQLVTFDHGASLAEIQRGAGLAGALGARSANKPIRWIMTEGRMRKWKLLFDAGFEVYYKFERPARFGRTPTERKRLNYAVHAARELADLGELEPAAQLPEHKIWGQYV